MLASLLMSAQPPWLFECFRRGVGAGFLKRVRVPLCLRFSGPHRDWLGGSCHAIQHFDAYGGIGENVAEKCTAMVGERNTLCALFVVYSLSSRAGRDGYDRETIPENSSCRCRRYNPISRGNVNEIDGMKVIIIKAMKIAM